MQQTTSAESAPRALLAAIYTAQTLRECEASLDELERLADTAGMEAFARITQPRQNPDRATYLGTGKLKEASELCAANGISTVVFDCELSPSQIRNIEKEMPDDVRVIDRTMLILEIFSMRAATSEGKLQVEIAELRYSYPRLTGRGIEMSRMGGGGAGGGGGAAGSGGARRGGGETKLEADRRTVKARIAALKKELEQLEVTRRQLRTRRQKNGVPVIAVAGYTNAGKSTLLNALTDAGVLAEDKLFATLDPTVRRITLPSGAQALMADTVGFIRNLPHHLVEAFKSTLEEIRYADVILTVADASDPEHEAQAEVVRALLDDLGATEAPRVAVQNKADLVPGAKIGATGDGSAVYISATQKLGLDALLEAAEDALNGGRRRVTIRLPLHEQRRLAHLYDNATVITAEYLDDAVEVCAVADARTRGMLRQWIIEG